jgi:serine/threonine protein kinase
LILDGRFRVNALLGEGGFAKIYEIQNERGEIQALKVLKRQEKKAIELFQREAFALSQLSHPGIPEIVPQGYFTFFVQDESKPLHCLAMEKVKGLNLKGYILKRRKGVEQRIVLRWLQQLINILQLMHGHNVLHRDIKPSNIMLNPDGQLVLIDFGAIQSKRGAGSEDTRVACELYTPNEQLNGMAVPQSDFFALGRTIIFLLTAQDLKELYDTNTNELVWQPNVPELLPEFGNFLERLTAPAPTDRPMDANELAEEVDKLIILQQQASPLASLENFEEDMEYFVRPIHQEQTGSENPTTQSSGQSNSREVSVSNLSPSFIEGCQQKLAEFIGPIAPFICKQTLEQQPNISEPEFVDSLCLHLPDAQNETDFRKAVLALKFL